YNVGGGLPVSASLQELTALCREVTGRQVPIDPEPATSPVDIRVSLTDSGRAAREFGWAPRKTLGAIVEDICSWVREYAGPLRPIHPYPRSPVMNEPKLSVVIPAHNEEKTLPKTLRDLGAVLREAGTPHELLIVDDNSRDGTAGVVRALSAEDPAI